MKKQVVELTISAPDDMTRAEILSLLDQALDFAYSEINENDKGFNHLKRLLDVDVKLPKYKISKPTSLEES